MLSTYQYTIDDILCDHGQFIDPGVLVDDDRKVYIYCGYTHSYAAQINEKNMYEIIDNTFQPDILHNSVIGYRYYDFGEQPSTKTMNFHAHIRGTGLFRFSGGMFRRAQFI